MLIIAACINYLQAATSTLVIPCLKKSTICSPNDDTSLQSPGIPKLPLLSSCPVSYFSWGAAWEWVWDLHHSQDCLHHVSGTMPQKSDQNPSSPQGTGLYLLPLLLSNLLKHKMAFFLEGSGGSADGIFNVIELFTERNAHSYMYFV